VRDLISAAGLPAALDDTRGFDHGAFVPMAVSWPDATMPLVQLSLRSGLDPAIHLQLGRVLAPLRDESVLILGSGNITHNLRRLDWQAGAPVPQWAREFDAWVADVLLRRDFSALVDYPRRAPQLARAHPSDEHLRPLLVAAGAGSDGSVSFPVEGWEYGSLSRRTVLFG
jgi:4,5-DOPA dioxygenase extradiol